MPTLDRPTGAIAHSRHALAGLAVRRFLDRVATVRTSDDVLALLADPPPLGAPTRPHHDRLADFLSTHRPPPAADPEELAAYAGLIGRLMAAGAVSVQHGRGDEALAALDIARNRTPMPRRA